MTSTCYKYLTEVARALGARYLEVFFMSLPEARDIAECRWEGPCLEDACERLRDVEIGIQNALNLTDVYVFLCRDSKGEEHLLSIACIGMHCICTVVDDIDDAMKWISEMVQALATELEMTRRPSA